MGMLLITARNSDDLFMSCLIDDFERSLTFKIRCFIINFAIFVCSAHSKNKMRRNGISSIFWFKENSVKFIKSLE